LTLPAQRHLARVVHEDGSASLYLALQQGWAGSRGLGWFRSNDGGLHWSRYDAIQGDASHPDTADVIQLGQDLALVYSYEGPSLSGSEWHDVFFQRWRYDPETEDLQADPPVRVFDSTSDDTAYYRAEIAADSAGRLWVQAFRLDAGGTHAAAIAVSQDGGGTFHEQPDLAVLSQRGGGRLLSLGHRLIFLFHGHGLSGPAQFRMRGDSEPLGDWGPVQAAFSDGIYHGAALTAVATPSGGMHLVYKGGNDQMLWYRFFDGEGFGPRQLIDDASWWATQAAATLVGDDLHVFYNHVVNAETSYQVRFRKVTGGVVGPAVVIDRSQTFKGYPAALEQVPEEEEAPVVPCAFGFTEDAGSPGMVELVFAPERGGGPPPPPPPPGALLFSDDFTRGGNDLGPEWVQDSGLWLTTGEVAASDLDGEDLAYVPSVSCRDCSVEAAVVGFGVPEAALVLRVQGEHPADRYEVVVLSSGQVQIRRRLGGAIAVLGQAPGDVPPWDWSTLRLTAVGSNPVVLKASVNGEVLLSVVDEAPGALSGAGNAGLSTARAGVAWDRFRIRSE
jgi:hypothetical protein